MTESTNLTPLISSDIPEVSTAATEAVLLLNQLKNGAINKAEFDELIDDLTIMDNISKDMVTLEVYVEIQKAFAFILTLKSIAALI